jgi:hypothetical protein
MQKTKSELRRMPLHELVDTLESTYLLWRFEDRNSALEGSLAIYYQRLVQELSRRRRRRLSVSCTCQLCWSYAEAFWPLQNA